jgi:hypothetical protein
MIKLQQLCNSAWLYPALIMLSVFAASLVTFVYPHTTVRPLLIIWFLFICPGLSVVRFFQLREIVMEWLLALALSIAIDAGIAGGLLYAGRWSPVHILLVLLCLCFVGGILQCCFIRANTGDKAQAVQKQQG